MKRRIRFLTLFLVLTMLLPMAVVPALADGGNPIENLYIQSESATGTAQGTASANPQGDVNHHTSGVISVTSGDRITVGPILKDQSWFIMGYDASGNRVDAAFRVKPSSCAVGQAICGNAMIYTYTVPDGVASLRVTTSQMFFDSTLITKNRVFTKAEYFAYMDEANINVDYLRPKDISGELTNFFPVSDDTVMGKVAEGESTDDHYYRSTKLFDVESGDVIYYAAQQSESYHISYVDSEGVGYNIKPIFTILYEDLGRDYAIYAYRVRPGTKKIAVVLRRSDYEDGITLVTKNQPFTGDRYRTEFNIDLDAVNKQSPLYGLSGLFMGDSISFGLRDYPSYVHDPMCGKSWAGRISDSTGLDATNVSVSGATIAQSSNWVFNQFTGYTGRKFDLVVMHGGANDARYQHELGASMPLGTSAAELEAAANTGTFIGGLQWLFHNMKEEFPNAQLFFIANHKLDGNNHETRHDMSAYFNAAEELCEIYGVHFIDLYNNDELNNKLETKTTKYIPDTTHLNHAGYDILTPYIQSALEAVMHTHVYNIPKYNESNHWNECSCGSKENEADHVFGEWTEKDGKRIKSCECGYTVSDPNYKIGKSLPTGAIVGIIIGSVAGGGVVGFGLCLLVFRKKKQA